MAEKSVIEKVRDYAELVRQRFPVKKIILFGSWARGVARPDSDIDVAVVMEQEPEDVLSVETELFRLRREIDARIEPVLVNDNQDLSGFWEEISSYGLAIYG